MRRPSADLQSALICCLLLLAAAAAPAQGDLYLVFGSDTSIWDGLDVNRYVCHYQTDLYTATAGNTVTVFSDAFRQPLRDSCGRIMPLTWWMHSGNVFRHADNHDVPLANTITMHLMKRYHGEAISRFGDELTLHYHTWDWTDENGDGLYYWNQARHFSQCRDDFDLTLCDYLLEEELFPVSFRSGWHYMDNAWQARLDELLPFSLHNAWPSRKTTDDEPTDNIIDWSQAPSEWIPYHPSPQDYQRPGISKGWNVRCISLSSVKQATVEKMFAGAASHGAQLACLWSHLPESDFPAQISRAHELIAAAAKKYPNVRFHYLTAVDAYQAWLKTADHQAPRLGFTSTDEEWPRFRIETDEPIFQKEPFVAIRDIYQRRQILPCTLVGENCWEAISPVPLAELVKAGVALCDTVGNQAMAFIRFLSDDIYRDNETPGYREIAGTFSTIDSYAWGRDARAASVAPGDSAIIRQELPISTRGNYQLYCQMAPVSNTVDSVTAILTQYGRKVWRQSVAVQEGAKTWLRVASCELDPAGQPALYLLAHNRHPQPRSFSPDGIKITAVIPGRQLGVAPGLIQFSDISLYSRVSQELRLSNGGKEPLTIHSINSQSGLLRFSQSGPLVLAPFASALVTVTFTPDQPISRIDSIIVRSDDPVRPSLLIPVHLAARSYFVTVDDLDSSGYREYGDWRTSTAQAYGSRSRYVNLSGNSGARARFTAVVERSGLYEIAFLHPVTVNASNNALYTIASSGITLDSLYFDQNAGSGSWVPLGSWQLTAGVPVVVEVIHNGGHSAGAVLRADAIRFTLMTETAVMHHPAAELPPAAPRLWGNYPNPFNASTVIRFELPAAAEIRLEVHDLAGRMVRQLRVGRGTAGMQEIIWDGRDDSGGRVASGIYLLLLRSGDFALQRRLVLIR